MMKKFFVKDNIRVTNQICRWLTSKRFEILRKPQNCQIKTKNKSSMFVVVTPHFSTSDDKAH